MKKIFFITFLLIQSAVVFCQQPFTQEENKVFDKNTLSSYTLQLPTGKNTHLPVFSKKLLVFVFLSPECPLSKNYSLKLSEIKKRYDKQVNFVGIIPGKFDIK